jgi:hypothetical protein
LFHLCFDLDLAPDKPWETVAQYLTTQLSEGPYCYGFAPGYLATNHAELVPICLFEINKNGAACSQALSPKVKLIHHAVSAGNTVGSFPATFRVPNTCFLPGALLPQWIIHAGLLLSFHMIEHVLIACHAGIAGPSQSMTFQRNGIIHMCISQQIYNQFPADGVMHPAPNCLCKTKIKDAPTPVTPPCRQCKTKSDNAPPHQWQQLLSPGPLLASTSITPPLQQQQHRPLRSWVSSR